MGVTISEMAFITAEGEGTIHRGKDLLRVLYVPPYVTKRREKKDIWAEALSCTEILEQL